MDLFVSDYVNEGRTRKISSCALSPRHPGMSRLKDAVSGLELHLAEQEFIQMAGDSHLVLGMATCNELNIIKDVIHGASLDEKKFSSTGWSMELEGGDQESAQLDQLSVPHVRSMI